MQARRIWQSRSRGESGDRPLRRLACPFRGQRNRRSRARAVGGIAERPRVSFSGGAIGRIRSRLSRSYGRKHLAEPYQHLGCRSDRRFCRTPTLNRVRSGRFWKRILLARWKPDSPKMTPATFYPRNPPKTHRSSASCCRRGGRWFRYPSQCLPRRRTLSGASVHTG